MTPADLISILPLIVVAVTAVVVMVVISFHRDHRLTCALTTIGIAIAFLTVFAAVSSLPRQVTLLLMVDHYTIFYWGLILGGALAVVLLSYGYLIHRERPEEYYVLLPTATLGSMVLAASSHFATFFLGIETLSISLYALIAYRYMNRLNIEAAIKYLILSAASTSFLLFGIALLYGQTGIMELSTIALRTSASPQNIIMLAGVAMIVVGLGFKLGVVPFHMWTPDVFQGAPAPVAAFIATVSKGAIFALMLRFFTEVNIGMRGPLFAIFAIIAVASMCTGNLLALFQNNIKRLLAYSSIAHFGYLLVAFLSAGPLRTVAVSYYLAAYFVTIVGAFGVVTVLSGEEKDADTIEEYRGLYAHRPWLAITFTLMLLSLAGMPLTAGFIAKFFVMTAGVGSALFVLVIILVVNSAVGLFYYLRVIGALYLRPAATRTRAPLSLPIGGTIVLIAALILLVWWGVYPSFLAQVISGQ